MRRTPQSSRWMVLVVIVAGFGALQLSACSETSSKASSEKPAKAEVIKGSSFKRVTLSAKAAERLGIETAPVQVRSVAGKQRKVIPYAAVLYTPGGQAFTYTNSEPRTFVRQLIRIDHITGQRAFLSKGPPAGAAVVTVGAPELLGVEYEVEAN